MSTCDNTASSVRVKLYAALDKARWDEFVRHSKNGVFLFHRDYVEYHAERFQDHSLMFYQGDQLVAVMPMNIAEGAAVSHGGLTFGGIVSDHRMKTPLMLQVFSLCITELRALGLKKLVYKAVPHIYHTIPAEEDLYALFVNNARLFRRDVSSTIANSGRPPLAKGRKGAIKRGKSEGIEVGLSQDFRRFMAIEDANLQSRHGTRPVHTAEEIELLASRFPQNIKLFAAHRQGAMLAGVVVYESANVAHAQYIGSTDEGRALGALDCIVDYLLNEVCREKAYFDFGISTVSNGRTLNEGLIRNKEGFGARATVYDFYELDV